eukprot:TRINITY_DN46825_c0_g1_i1.p1 TRINITY_DN46825_c0_g1~~TRINITY_DN46825_c0_g1_i1.p1  ORF type:complete len:611 (+),score=198.67 TRINITY_DN46825_c0_g1_i1:120-1952(+)
MAAAAPPAPEGGHAAAQADSTAAAVTDANQKDDDDDVEICASPHSEVPLRWADDGGSPIPPARKPAPQTAPVPVAPPPPQVREGGQMEQGECMPPTQPAVAPPTHAHAHHPAMHGGLQQGDVPGALPRSVFCRWQLQTAARPLTPHTVVGVVHPSGRMIWLPYQAGWSTVEMVRAEVAARWRMAPEDLSIVSQSGSLSYAGLVDQLCHPGEILLMLPRKPSMHLLEPPADVSMTECLTPLAPEVGPMTFAQETDDQQAVPPPSTPDMMPVGGMGGGHGIGGAHGPSSGLVPSSSSIVQIGSGPCTPLSPGGMGPPQYTVVLTQGGGANWGAAAMSIEEKLHYAATNIGKLIGQTKQCTELQADMEQAVRQGIDCSHVFAAIEQQLPELILHPAGNYLVSRCFDFCPSLIETAAQLICRNIRQYCLHKHGSYVVEAIIEHQCTSPTARSSIIAQLIAPQHRVSIAGHDSGNFVLQKAISCVPDSLLQHMVDAVRSVQNATPHAAKMAKKLEQRLQRSPNGDRYQRSMPSSNMNSHSMYDSKHGMRNAHKAHSYASDMISDEYSMMGSDMDGMCLGRQPDGSLMHHGYDEMGMGVSRIHLVSHMGDHGHYMD